MSLSQAIKHFLTEVEIQMSALMAAIGHFECLAQDYVKAQNRQAAAIQLIAAKLPEIEDVEELFEDVDPADEVEPSGKN